MPFPEPAAIHWHSVYLFSACTGQDIGGELFIPPKKPKERGRKKGRKSKKTVISIWLSRRFLPFSLKKIFYSSFIFENFICILPPEHNAIDLFKIFILNYSIKKTQALAGVVENNMATKFILNRKLRRLCLQTSNDSFFANY